MGGREGPLDVVSADIVDATCGAGVIRQAFVSTVRLGIDVGRTLRQAARYHDTRGPRNADAIRWNTVHRADEVGFGREPTTMVPMGRVRLSSYHDL